MYFGKFKVVLFCFVLFCLICFVLFVLSYFFVLFDCLFFFFFFHGSFREVSFVLTPKISDVFSKGVVDLAEEANKLMLEQIQDPNKVTCNVIMIDFAMQQTVNAIIQLND